MKNTIEIFENLDKSFLILINVLLIFFLGSIDFFTGIEFDFSIFYLIPISLTSWFASKRLGILSAIISETIWFIADVLGEHIYSSTLILFGNSVLRLCLFITIALLLSKFKLIQKKQYHAELLIQKNKYSIETFQKLTAIISENIIQQNAEIIMWVNKKKSKGENVPQKVEKASQIIGLSMRHLSETSYLDPYKNNLSVDSESYLQLLKQKLSEINLEINLNKKAPVTNHNK